MQGGRPEPERGDGRYRREAAPRMRHASQRRRAHDRDDAAAVEEELRMERHGEETDERGAGRHPARAWRVHGSMKAREQERQEKDGREDRVPGSTRWKSSAPPSVNVTAPAAALAVESPSIHAYARKPAAPASV